MRVYEIAREVGLPNKELIAKIRALGLEVNNHMSSLDPDAVARVKRSLERERVENTVTKRLSSTVLRRRTKGQEEGAPIAVIAATNRRDLVDESLLQPGRFGTMIALELPDATERADILTLCLGQDPRLARLVAQSEGWSRRPASTRVPEITWKTLQLARTAPAGSASSPPSGADALSDDHAANICSDRL